ncbi:secretin N-terminal domain-containing protein [Planctomicrobium sp. SH661]|uniref:secretin N-terminal domain-containing protein n=1 Tax=Planctomicrobium sp. SH661 TaxID=3448124 RepID=UPI003F5B8689
MARPDTRGVVSAVDFEVRVSSSTRKPLLLAQVTVDGPSATPADKPPAGASPEKVQEKNANELKKKKEGEAAKPGAEGGAKPAEKPEPPPVIMRPTQPETPPDANELEIVPDSQGKVRFNFSRQPWLGILEWLARISHLSLDWQELPAGYLDLRTQRDYTVEEARDLINRHLLTRGFTMLKSGEVLTVVNISKMNLALVPRVEPDELVQRLGSEFVKVSFPLKWMMAERAAEELKPMLSANGKLFPLKEMNRIEAVDAVSNLLDIHRVLQQTQSDDVTKNTIVREFRLEHRRAADVVLLVEAILGLENKRLPIAMGRGGGGGGGDMMSYQIMNQLQQMQQMMQQNQGNQGAAGKPGKEPDPRLIVNDLENSILAHANAEKMEIIAQTIKAIDVPGNQNQELLHSISRVKPYRLSTADPQPIMILLKEMGNLSPQSKIQIDEKSRSIILYGTLADHYTTQSLIERLDGTNRNFEVVQLRRLRADAVAGTIQYLLGAEDEDKSKNNNRYPYYWGYNSSSSSTKEKEERPFKVDADVDLNRLLLWANDVELQEVRQLLLKMGEVPPGMSNPEMTRSIEMQSDRDADQLLEKLKTVWPELESNPLHFGPVRPQAPIQLPGPPQTNRQPAQGAISLAADEAAAGNSTMSNPIRLAWWPDGSGENGQLNAESPASIAAAPRESVEGERPPISIQRLPDGRIVYSSPDTRALDRLEDLISEISPPHRDYHVFQLKYPTTWAYGIEMILDDYFDDPSLKESTFDPWWGTTSTTKAKGSNRLSRKKELKVISNDDSHTILVQGATQDQLKIIGELIEVYDRPTSNDPQAVRKTEVFPMQYSRATAVAEAVKQVYRDLLSANDPALQNPNQQKPSEEPKFTYIYGRANTADSKEDSPAQPIKFKGLLSVGVDEVSNTVIVSSTEGLMREIRLLIEQLDQAAKPSNSVQVMQVRNINPEVLQQRLNKSFSGPVIRTSETGQRTKKQNSDQNRNSPSDQNGQQSQGSGNSNSGGNNGSASSGD